MEKNLASLTSLPTPLPGPATIDIIIQILESPTTYLFGELCYHDAILEAKKVEEEVGVANSPYKGWIRILYIFAFHTLADYKEQKSFDSCLPDLSLIMMRKLRQLSLISLIGSLSANSVFKYSQLKKELFLEDDSTEEIESLIIDSVYKGLIEGKIDTINQEIINVRVGDKGGRDIIINGNRFDTIRQVLNNWLLSSGKLLEEIEENICKVKADLNVRTS
ncbi:hypothetical protein NADFUDRAFT_49122 [Nadsonia fulvescens var. elongata DSM 6958]|uniref:PCI domain-containing protein n=1 Tax=Nadsonia fulvescens var. elongata DSM 6958 TaxID=857566 RepID=A0A1E3PT94_9ASCO|nr:hypothetical protein NADFUDRAFT_49122 [Nadsonia fulvescens var. elongata DSM 6958]